MPLFRTALVVAPATVLDNWLDEVDKWGTDKAYGCYRVRSEDPVKKRLGVLQEWHRLGGLAVIGFEARASRSSRAVASPAQISVRAVPCRG